MSEDDVESTSLSSDPVTELSSFSVEELFQTLEASNGEVVLDFGVDSSFDSRIFIRVYNNNPQLLRVEESTNSSEAQLSSAEIEMEQFESFVKQATNILLRPREKTPFSRDVQDQLRN